MSIDIIDLKNHYQDIFSNSFEINLNNKEIGLNAIESLINRSLFTGIDLDYLKFSNAIKKTNSSHVCGLDNISTFMLKNTSDSFKKTYIFTFPFFKFIFKNCIIPDNFNISFIKPIIKDHKKSNSDIKNLRHISISNSLSQLFERLIIECIPEITTTHSNQFGYKNKTVCLHFLFCIRETIINLIENKKPCYIISFDAEKAFDKLWRLTINFLGNLVLI